MGTVFLLLYTMFGGFMIGWAIRYDLPKNLLSIIQTRDCKYKFTIRITWPNLAPLDLDLYHNSDAISRLLNNINPLCVSNGGVIMPMTKHDYNFLAAAMKQHMEDIDEERKPETRLAFLSLAIAISMDSKRYPNFNHKKFLKAAGLKEE